MPTSPNPSQQVKPREYELEATIHQNVSTPGVRELLEYAKLKAAVAHANYLKTGPDNAMQNWAMERAWLDVARVIENGPKFDRIQPGGNNNG